MSDPGKCPLVWQHSEVGAGVSELLVLSLLLYSLALACPVTKLLRFIFADALSEGHSYFYINPHEITFFCYFAVVPFL